MSDGERAAELLADDMFSFDAVVLDDSMGGGEKDGRETLSRVEMAFARAGVQLPTLVLMESSLSTDSDRSDASAADASAADGKGALDGADDEAPAEPTFQLRKKPLTQPTVSFLVQKARDRKRRKGPPAPPRSTGVERASSYHQLPPSAWSQQAPATASAVRIDSAASTDLFGSAVTPSLPRGQSFGLGTRSSALLDQPTQQQTEPPVPGAPSQASLQQQQQVGSLPAVPPCRSTPPGSTGWPGGTAVPPAQHITGAAGRKDKTDAGQGLAGLAQAMDEDPHSSQRVGGLF